MSAKPGRRELELTAVDRRSLVESDRVASRRMTPEERLDAVEMLRLQAGKFLYDYPSRLRRLLTVTRSPLR
ncbi:MAG: hypothetical protein K8S94_00635 [Planctomycetia bacterium]|nr:hypothetical protein [Planctomycetia bacterium]